MSIKKYPSNTDYTIIIEHLSSYIIDSQINTAIPLYTKTDRLISYAGGYSKVFPVQIKTSKKAFRFWTANVENSQKRYQEIDQYLKKNKLPYFVAFDYHQDKLNWEETDYSFVSMDWAEGVTLNEYIDNNINDSGKMQALANSFFYMVVDLHKHEIAHGDLQDGNIIVIEDGNEINLKLIDYDSLYVPALKNYDIEIIGVEAYQHPKKTDFKYMNEKIDYFSELVIYLSLLVYVEDSSLWIHGQDQRLLFELKDYKNTDASEIFKKLKSGSFSSKIVELTYKLESFCSKYSLNDLLPLEESIRDKFKELSELFDGIVSESSPTGEQVIDDDIFNKKQESIKIIFSDIPKKEQIDKAKFNNLIKKMRSS